MRLLQRRSNCCHNCRGLAHFYWQMWSVSAEFSLDAPHSGTYILTCAQSYNWLGEQIMGNDQFQSRVEIEYPPALDPVSQGSLCAYAFGFFRSKLHSARSSMLDALAKQANIQITKVEAVPGNATMFPCLAHAGYAGMWLSMLWSIRRAYWR